VHLPGVTAKRGLRNSTSDPSLSFGTNVSAKSDGTSRGVAGGTATVTEGPGSSRARLVHLAVRDHHHHHRRRIEWSSRTPSEEQKEAFIGSRVSYKVVRCRQEDRRSLVFRALLR